MNGYRSLSWMSLKKSRWSQLQNFGLIVITPHFGAEIRPADLVEIFVENYISFSNGQELKYKINWNAGY